ncbi:MAG: phage integrase N-terminal SAM-like domain-containing protein, partial [Spirosomaceae bacterium]|nr:phage integrase N-terminal SAM-like domain-containing protein [Spirosomataceae bacterium]
MIKCSLSEDLVEIKVEFANDPVWNERIRHVKDRRWSNSRKCWLVPNTRENVVKIGQLFGKEKCRFAEEIIRLYKPEATIEEINRYLNPPRKRWANKPIPSEYDTCAEVIALHQEIKLRNYSHKTFRNYKSALVSLMIHVKQKPLDMLTLTELKSFFLYLIEKRKLSGSSLNVYINAINYDKISPLNTKAKISSSRSS